MIIDHHIHAVRRDPDTPAGFREYLGKSWPGDLDEFLARHEDPAVLEAHMDEAGIDYAVVLAETNPVTTPMITNEFVADFCRGRKRFIPFASINPYLVHNPAAYLRRLVEEMGFRGLKLYPTYQYYYPNDPMLYPLYAVCQELGLPVMAHTGSSVFPGSRLKYGQPLHFDDVAVDFPDLNLLLCHCGRPIWYDEAFALARFHRNVYMEISGLPPQKLLTYFPELERLAHKVIYGSDWPGFPSLSANVAAIRGLPIGEQAKAAILGGNAARLHGLHVNGG
ncbi:MAG TPA: amidohydrolase family protein [Symbiobacteriaceae bacterium]|nr:amidohydrolase family protein [Symbiobacteriaceae bacterium]